MIMELKNSSSNFHNKNQKYPSDVRDIFFASLNFSCNIISLLCYAKKATSISRQYWDIVLKIDKRIFVWLWKINCLSTTFSFCQQIFFGTPMLSLMVNKFVTFFETNVMEKVGRDFPSYPCLFFVRNLLFRMKTFTCSWEHFF